jgi:hypothetical protein
MNLRLKMLSCFFMGMMALSLWPQQSPLPSGESSSKHHPKLPKQAAPSLDPGSITDGIYRNASFGFTYKLPFGWVNRTNEMQDDSPDAAQDSTNKDPAKSVVLLAMFERPPEAPRDAINPGVVIAGESLSAYPGLKTAADYFEPLTQLTTEKGFKVVNEPYQFPVGVKTLVRSDFSKEMGKLTIYQTCLAFLGKGYVVSLTLIGGSEDEVNSLIENLSFGPANAKK